MPDISAFLFWTIAILTGLCAVAVVVSQNIVRAATWLLFTLGGVSGVFFLLGADFVGATQLLVYVGGTLVLVIFGVMLTAQGPFVSMKTGAAEWGISGLVGLSLFAVLTVSALSVGDPRNTVAPVVKAHQPKAILAKDLKGQANTPREKSDNEAKVVARSQYTDTIGLSFLGLPVGPAYKEGGRVVRTHYFLPFLIVSVHLLVVLIGAAYLARAKRRRAPRGHISEVAATGPGVTP
jgi:NADH:ubiquinone oxidoreductase subunit 6 (subunit J)